MCPCLSSRSRSAICRKSLTGNIGPSGRKKEAFCPGVCELCHVFAGEFKTADDDGAYRGGFGEQERREICALY
jgi:hypothetical protein